jgi:hypothetical protein
MVAPGTTRAEWAREWTTRRLHGQPVQQFAAVPRLSVQELAAMFSVIAFLPWNGAVHLWRSCPRSLSASVPVVPLIAGEAVHRPDS